MNEFLKHRQKYLLMSILINGRPLIQASNNTSTTLIGYVTIKNYRLSSGRETGDVHEYHLNFRGYWKAYCTCKELGIWNRQKVEAFNDMMP
jgi:hypothetical protein